jgi:topoisomerase IA-like protein
MLFDLTGTRHDTPMKTKKIDLTGFGVRGEDNDDLQPEENPHTVSEQFAKELIQTNRAVEHDPDNPIGGPKAAKAKAAKEAKDAKDAADKAAAK